MKKPKPSLKPQKISSNVWYYENLRSFTFVVAVYHEGKFIKNIQARIPASKIERSLKRMGKPPRRSQ